MSEDALKAVSMMFRNFNKNNTGRLAHIAFKSCLGNLDYDLPMMEPEPKFQTILNVVDPKQVRRRLSLMHVTDPDPNQGQWVPIFSNTGTGT